jgi:hypothetical protein
VDVRHGSRLREEILRQVYEPITEKYGDSELNKDSGNYTQFLLVYQILNGEDWDM